MMPRRYNRVMKPDEVAALLRLWFADHETGAIAVYLFGSVARGTARTTSDVDVAVLFRTTPTPTLDSGRFDLESALDAVLHRPVQVVVLNTAPPDLVHRVLRDGILVLDRDPSTRLQFEVRLRNEYFDLEPVRRMYRNTPLIPQTRS